MNKNLTIIGLSMTFCYLMALYYGIEGRLAQIKTMDLNNLGDFFAGVFGPLAILWLILGFFQQGKELKQNTEALRLQAEELRNSVKQQEKLAKTTQRQLNHQIFIDNTKQSEIENLTKPKFIIVDIDSFLEEPERSVADDEIYTIDITLKNTGNVAENIRIEVKDKRLEEMFGWHHHGCNKDENIEFRFRIQFNSYSRDEDIKVQVVCTYDYINIKDAESFIELDVTNLGSGESGVIGTIRS